MAAARRRLLTAPYTGLPALHLERADLSGAHLKGAALHEAHLERAVLNEAHLEGVALTAAHLERAVLRGAHLERAYLLATHLEGADLTAAHLERAVLSGAHLEGANLLFADLKRAELLEVHLEGANLSAAHLEWANLSRAHLEGAGLSGLPLGGDERHTAAHLEWANLTETHLEGADLRGTHLERANLSAAHLEGADLRLASFDKASRLNGAHLDGIALDQVIFDNTNLTVVPWGEVQRLGDERLAREAKGGAAKVDLYRAAARAYRALSLALRIQGITKDAARFHYRAEVMHTRERRHAARSRMRWFNLPIVPFFFVPWLALLIFGACAGYGVYHLWRLALTYLGVVGAFAAAFLVTGIYVPIPNERPLTWSTALVLSLTTIHGRVFTSPFLLDSIQAWIAAAEAVFGLLIEGLFIAAFTRRVTGG